MPDHLYRIHGDGEYGWHVIARSRTHALRVVAGYDEGFDLRRYEGAGGIKLPRPLVIERLHGNRKVAQWASGDGPGAGDVRLTAREWVARCLARGEDHVTAG